MISKFATFAGRAACILCAALFTAPQMVVAEVRTGFRPQEYIAPQYEYLPADYASKILNLIKQKLSENTDSNVKLDAALCVVVNGKTQLVAKDFLADVPEKNVEKKANGASELRSKKLIALPLGRSGLALQSLASLEMLEQKKLPKFALSKWTERGGAERDTRSDALHSATRISDICSLFSAPENNAALTDLIDMKAGVPPRLDSSIPFNATPDELFSIVSSTPEKYPSSAKFGRGDFSATSAALFAYTMAYAENKNVPNLCETYREKILKKYLAIPLGFSGMKMVSISRYDGVPKSLEAAYAIALPVEDVSKWLECETSPAPKISTRKNVLSRRNSAYPAAFISAQSNENFSGGWLSARCDALEFFVASDSFRGYANIVAIFPKYNAAVAVFVYGKSHTKDAPLKDFKKLDSVSSKACGAIFAEILKILAE